MPLCGRVACARHAGGCPIAHNTQGSCAACAMPSRAGGGASIHRWHERPPSGRGGPQEEHRLLQRRSGPCDDATNSVAHPLQRSIACCHSARQVRATTQPQQLPLRCNSASRVATALSRSVRRRNQHCCPYVAAAHRVLQQRSVRRRRTAARERSLLQRRTACCNSVRLCCKQVDAPLVAAHWNGAACCNACCNAVQPAVAQPNLLQKAHGSSDAH